MPDGTRRCSIPVTLVVPKYRQGVNAGGAAYADRAGDPGRPTRPGPRRLRLPRCGLDSTTKQPIAGTEDDPLHQTVRESTSGYRFDNLPGRNVCRWNWTSASPRDPGAGPQGVRCLGQRPAGAADYDPVAAVGTLALDHREFDGRGREGGAIAIDFGAMRGKLPPIVTSVRVTHRPDR